jgi:hypothetical protein
MRKLLIICFVLSLYATGFSQFGYPQNRYGLSPFKADTINHFPRFIDRLYYGGNVGLWIGNPTYINAAPMLGVKITKKLSLGATFTYNYYQQKYLGVRYTSSIYGAGPFVRYRVTDNLFIQAQWDRLSVINPNSIIENDRVWVDNLLIGGGYRQPFSNYGSFVIMAFWNLNETPLSPYPNPIIQMGFNLRF